MTATAMEELGIDPVEVDEMLARNMTFPARWYSDPRIYEFELERIFTRTWSSPRWTSIPSATDATMAEWVEMYDRTLTEDSQAVLVQQPALRSRMVPYGRLMPSRESAISHFHHMVWEAFSEALEG